MKEDIHPEWKESKIKCTCGNVIKTRSTKEEMHVEVCSNCHPVYKRLREAGEIPDITDIE